MTVTSMVLAVLAAVMVFRGRGPAGGPGALSAVGVAVVVSVLGTLSGRSPDGSPPVWGPALVPLLTESAGLILVVARMAHRARPWPALFGAGAAGAAAALLVLRVTGPPSLLAAIGACALWSLPAAGAAAVGLHLRGQDRRRDRAAGEALRGQRLSLARDLHDYVAHDVSEMLATAQAGRVAGGDPATAAVLFERIEQAGQHALATLDRTVHMLGGQPPAPGESPASGRTSLLGELSLLVARFGGAGPVRAELDMEPLPADAVTSEVAALTHRIVTEGLTNVRRHAAAAAGVAVAVTRTRAGMLTVTVTDHPPATPVGPVPEAVSRTARGGRGLPELAAAAAALGGVLVAGPHGGGWRLRADLPLRAGSGRRAGGDRR